MTEKEVRNIIADASDASEELMEFIEYLTTDNHIGIDVINGMVVLGIGATEGKGIIMLEPDQAMKVAKHLVEAATHLINPDDQHP